MGLFNKRKQTGEKCNYKFKLDSTSKKKKVGFTLNNTGINVVVNTAQRHHVSHHSFISCTEIHQKKKLCII